jgi:HSP20 family protein
MSRKSSAEVVSTEESIIPVIVKSEKFTDRLKDFYQSIRQRAHELFTVRGGGHGRDLEDWFRAEAELFYPVPAEITESDGKLIVKAEAPGFKADELELAVEPYRLILSGSAERTVKREMKEGSFSESRTDEIFRALDLPVEIDPTQVEARLKKGVLEITLAKASITPPTRIEING